MNCESCDHIADGVVHLSEAGDLERLVQRVITEIRQDIDAGIVPRDVRHFHELHDYVDANEYGGLDGYADCVVNEVQDRADAVLSGGVVVS